MLQNLSQTPFTLLQNIIIMYKRNILENLIDWKNRDDRKPLILRGARQVGKTTAVNLFAENFDNFIEINLELFEDRKIFREEYNIDEIQNSP